MADGVRLTVSATAPGTTAPPPRRRRGGRPWLVGNALAAVTVGAVNLALTRASGLVDDDVYNLDVVAALGRESVTFPVFFTQWAPGHRVMTMLQWALGPHEHLAMHAVLAALLVAVHLTAVAVATDLHGRRPWIPLAFLVALVGPAALHVTSWYSTAFHEVPSLLAGLLTVLAWRRSRRADAGDAWLALSVLSLSIGLLFSIRTVLAVLVVVVLEVLDQDVVDRRTWWRPLRAHRSDLAWFALPVGLGAYLTLRFVQLPQEGDVLATLDAALLALFTRTIPLLFGADVQGFTNGWRTVVVWVAVLTLVAYAWHATWRSRTYAWAIAGAVLVVVAALGMSSFARVAVLGEAAALPLRYQLQPVVYVLLLLPMRDRWVARPRGATRPTPILAITAAGVYLATSAILVSISDAGVMARWTGRASAEWFGTLVGDVAARQADTSDASSLGVLATPLPSSVMPSFPGRTLADADHLVPGLEVVQAPGSLVVTADGHLEAPSTAVLFEQDGAAITTNALVTISGDPVVDETTSCTTDVMTLTFVLAPHAHPRLVALEVVGPSTVTVDYVPHAGQPGEPDQSATIEDAEVVWMPLDLSGYTAEARTTIRSQPGETACLETVRFLEVFNDLPLAEGAPRHG